MSKGIRLEHCRGLAAVIGGFLAVTAMWGAVRSDAATPSAAPKGEPASLRGFIDDRGQMFEASSTAKPLRLLVFGYTSCPDVCPLTLVAVHRALEQLGSKAADVDPDFVTVDPDRDSVEKLHQYVTAFDARIRAYRGGDADLDRLTKSLHVRFWREALTPDSKDYWMSHTSKMFLLSPAGRVLATIEHLDNPNKLAQAIVAAVNGADPAPKL